MMQRMPGKEKMPGTGVETELVPEKVKDHESFKRIISPRESNYPGHLLSPQDHEVPSSDTMDLPEPQDVSTRDPALSCVNNLLSLVSRDF